MGDLKDKIQSTKLVNKLIDKSQEGKLDWQPTANRCQFLTSIGGDTTFRIHMVNYKDYDEYGELETLERPRLDMLDKDGNTLWEIQAPDVPFAKMNALYKLARRIGNRLDDRLSVAFDALDEL